MQLSPHFNDSELGVIGVERRIIDNAIFLCINLLEPIRQHFKRPLNVHDGYRNPQHNTSVGGKSTSFHLYNGGQSAADFDVGGDSYPTYQQVFDWIRLESKLQFDKIILEHNSSGENAALHIQVDRNNTPRHQSYIGGTGNSQQYILVETV